MPYAFVRDVPFNEEQYADIRAEIGDETPKGLINPRRRPTEHGPALHRRLGHPGGLGAVPR